MLKCYGLIIISLVYYPTGSPNSITIFNYIVGTLLIKIGKSKYER